MKKAVILFNLGGPDKIENVEPFLFNLFNDPAILNLPTILRYPLAKLISNRRAPVAKKIYKELGGSSPILKLTMAQSKALETKLNQTEIDSEYKCFIVMRCWNPRANDVIKDVQSFNPEEIILMPLYPQYSAATSGSSIKEWRDVCKKNNYHVKTNTICCYPTDQNFINAHTKEIIKKIKDLKNFKLIFSAHGLPEKNIKKGDPYQWQVEQSVKKIVENLNIENLDWILSYQSRVGPLKWIGPSTEDIIVENSKLAKHIVLVPIAFVSEHSETLVELDIEYKEIADANGCKNYTRVPALGTNEDFIKAMSELIIKKNEYKFSENLYPPKIQCPSNFKKCPCLNYE
ncbi:ferrochelatase [Candidatus Pelagibacter communis]|uniref:Ferrochelatase n=1 Tax=Pelagibacter ubique (strain HTCC1062) TaxID=335992 RepID=HEMH_PELUB|nr:ferrochelatase [Candidatus Pelagibacter ubique]Q4FNS1.1 RecName: Full=Ferrochelatase; AltName: Full=Heme synthase; AltName: Full=Protoheme ferro-lyase [Candidatus Pelagibacter ubique HTCC1062]AAZ21168.1 probable ferrochelatase [Candidatus Pelagibacter ubique HTCC1062]